MNIIKNSLLVLISSLFIACGNNTQDVVKDIKSIKINEANLTMYSTDADKEFFKATVYFNDGTQADATEFVTWNSSDSTIASVSKGTVKIGTKNGGDFNLSISYNNLESALIPLNIIKLTDYNISLLNADANETGAYKTSAMGLFEDNTSHLIVKNIVWDANNSATREINDNITSITLVAGDTNISSRLFDDTNFTKSFVYTAN